MYMIKHQYAIPTLTKTHPPTPSTFSKGTQSTVGNLAVTYRQFDGDMESSMEFMHWGTGGPEVEIDCQDRVVYVQIVHGSVQHLRK